MLKKNSVDLYEIEANAVIDEWEKDPNVPPEMPETTGLRISHITVKMSLKTTSEYKDRADRCLTVYDEGCVVGQSIGISYEPLTSLEIVGEL